jgi:histidyl-tRNA synthetase
MFQAPRGTQDILPEEQPYWHYIQDTAEAVARLYGYGRIDTPIFEEAGLFVRTVGEGTDIVEKEMYTFTDLGGSQMTLRPEGTAPVCRAYIEHGMASLPQPVKLYYLAPIFRYERPQAGRFREHHQFGFEAIGEAGASLDAEVIDMAWHFFKMLGLNDLTLQINSIGCPRCRPAYLKTLCEYYQDKKDQLCAECKIRLEKNTLRLLDCKKPDCQVLATRAPHSIDNLCSECRIHFEELKQSLENLELPYNINHNLVRGLDYYTRTVFEIQPLIEGGQSTIGGGGRYDGLIEQLGGKATPGVGFATGIERVILNLKRQNIHIPGLPKPEVFVSWVGEKARTDAIKLISKLRNAHIQAITVYSPKSLKSQLRQSDTFGCNFTVIIGEEELARGIVTLRNMHTAQQEEIAADRLLEKLKGVN